MTIDAEMRLWRAVLRAPLLVVLLVGFPGAAGAQEAFPAIGWGTPLAEARRQCTLERAAVEGNVERYGFSLDELGKARIRECLFEFTDGRFSGIVLTTRGKENTEALHQYLAQRFGQGSDDGHRFWQWLSDGTYVSLDEDSAGDGYVLWYGVKWQGKR